MRIRRHAVLRGANLYAPVPVSRMALDVTELGLAEPGSAVQDATVEQALDRIADVLPWALQTTALVDAQTVGPEARLATLVMRCALALQREFGFEVGFGQVAASREGDGYVVTYEYRDPAHSRLAGVAAVAVVAAAMNADLAAVLATQLEALRDRTLGVVTRRLIWEAERRGIPWSRVLGSFGVVRLGQGQNQKHFYGTYSSDTSWLSSAMATSKSGAASMLRAQGIPVPRQILTLEIDEAVAAAGTLGYPLVVKPDATDQGLAVVIGIESEESLRAAFIAAREHGPVLVEQQIVGRDYRVTVIDGRMVAAGRNMPARVLGDGRRSVRELIEIENSDPRRGTRDFSIMKTIVVDAEIENTLKEQDYALESVPARDTDVALRTWWRHANDGWGLDVTADVHPDNQAMLERATRLVGLDIAGVDFITPDISQPWYEIGGAINEVNPTPGLNTHVKAGAPDINKILLEAFFAPGQDGRIPTALLLQSDRDPALAMIIDAILRSSGHCVGLAAAEGLMIDGRRVQHGESVGAGAMHRLLSDPAVSAAVVAMSDHEALALGLGLDRIGVCAIRKGLGGERLKQAGVQPAQVGRLVTAATDSLLVLDADDSFAVQLGTKNSGTSVCWVAGDGDSGHLMRRVAADESVVAVTEVAGRKTIVHSDREGTTPVLPLAEALSRDGRESPSDVTDILFAVAVTLGLGLTPHDLAIGLASRR